MSCSPEGFRGTYFTIISSFINSPDQPTTRDTSAQARAFLFAISEIKKAWIVQHRVASHSHD